MEEIAQIKRQHSAGKNYVEIAKIINTDRFAHKPCTPSGIRKRIIQNNKVGNKGSHKPLTRVMKFGRDALAFIDAAINADREISAADLQQRLQKELKINVGTTTINRARRELGWIRTTTKYCQLVRMVN